MNIIDTDPYVHDLKVNIFIHAHMIYLVYVS